MSKVATDARLRLIGRNKGVTRVAGVVDEAQVYSRATQSWLRETSSMELSIVQNSRSIALRPLQLFWSRKTIACEHSGQRN